MLGSDKSAVERAIVELSDAANVDLWVLFVSTTGDVSAPDYSTQVFDANGLGGNDIVLVGGGGRSALRLDSRRGHRAVLRRSRSAGRADTWIPTSATATTPRGVISLAGAIASELGRPIATPAVTPATPGATTPVGGSTGKPSDGLGGFGDGLLLFLAVLGLVFIVLAVVGAVRVHRLSKLPLEERDRTTGDLARQANKLLVDTDDAVAEAKQELGFAQAEFGAADTEPFEAAIGKAEDGTAPGLRPAPAAGRLDARAARRADPDVPARSSPTARPQRPRSVSRSERVDAIRKLEENAPEALKTIDRSVDALQARLPSIKAAQKTLSGFARIGLGVGQGQSRGGRQARRVRRAADRPGQEGAGQGAAGQARSRQRRPCRAGGRGRRQPAARRRGAAGPGTPRGAVQDRRRVARGRRTRCESAGSAAQAGQLDAQATGYLAEARALLDAARGQARVREAGPDRRAQVRPERPRRRRRGTGRRAPRGGGAGQEARRLRLGAWPTATTSVARASAYLGTRRGGIGTTARTRLAEASSHLEQANALASSDPTRPRRRPSGPTPWRTRPTGWPARTSKACPTSAAYARQLHLGRGGSGGRRSAGLGRRLAGRILGRPAAGAGRGGRGGFGGSSWGSSGGWSGGGARGSWRRRQRRRKRRPRSGGGVSAVSAVAASSGGGGKRRSGGGGW